MEEVVRSLMLLQEICLITTWLWVSYIFFYQCCVANSDTFIISLIVFDVLSHCQVIKQESQPSL